jgi:LmbE family N-acetylglucosaminyl deacetylase
LDSLTPPVVIVSPHYDDAAFSCATVLAESPGSTVVTVFSGAPKERRRGYNFRTTRKIYAPDAMALRRAENEQALSMVKARPESLDLLEADYSDRRIGDYSERASQALVEKLDSLSPSTLLTPLGLAHPDHLMVATACQQLWRRVETAVIYLDLPYGLDDPFATSKRLDDLSKTFSLRELSLGRVPTYKRELVAAYASQYRATRRNFHRVFDAAMDDSERYWHVLPEKETH